MVIIVFNIKAMPPGKKKGRRKTMAMVKIKITLSRKLTADQLKPLM